MSEDLPESLDSHDTQHGPRYHGEQRTDNTGYGHIHADHVEGGVNTYNTFYTGTLINEQVRRSVSWPMNKKTIKHLRERFVAPPLYERAEYKLTVDHTVVITGEPGTGRHSTAVKLLADVTSEARELPSDPSEWSVPDESDESDGLLLNLSPYSFDEIIQVHEHLRKLHAKIGAQYPLSMVIHPEAEEALPNDLRSHIVRIGRPDAREVLRNHLRAEEIEHDPDDLDAAELRGIAMADLERLTQRTKEEHTHDPDRPFDTLFWRAWNCLRPPVDAGTRWLGSHRTGPERALILATAMLEGAPTDAVWLATDSLLKTTNHPRARTQLLERQGMSERLAWVGIEAQDSTGVVFPTPGDGAALRERFWAEHPELRGKFREWIGQLAQRDLPESARDRMVVWFAEQALNTGRPNDLRSVAEQWVKRTGHRDYRTLLRCVHLVLQTGLRDERFGGWFRNRIYWWTRRAKTSELPEGLDDVLVNLSAEVIAPAYPDQALVRLRHLIRRDSALTKARATGRIVLLAEDSEFFFRLVLDRLARELRSKDDAADTALFLDVARPSILLAGNQRAVILDQGIRNQLIACWRVVLHQPSSVWASSVHRWLAESPDDASRQWFQDVLIESCGGEHTLLSRLYRVATSWARCSDRAERSRRGRIVTELSDRIDRAQDLDFLTTTGATPA